MQTTKLDSKIKYSRVKASKKILICYHGVKLVFLKINIMFFIKYKYKNIWITYILFGYAVKCRISMTGLSTLIAEISLLTD